MYKRIAHRANIDRLLENSLSAIQSCVKQNVEGIEIDILHTADSKAIVFHDKNFDRLAYAVRQLGSYKPLVSQISLEEIHREFRLSNGEPIPKLQDALDLVQNRDHMMFLEFKDRPSAATLKMIKNAFENSLERLRLISFDHELLLKLKGYDDFFAQVKMLALHEIPRTTWLPLAIQGLEGVNANIFHPAHALYLKSQGLEVGIWWLPDKIPPLFNKALFRYIDFITTDNYNLY